MITDPNEHGSKRKSWLLRGLGWLLKGVLALVLLLVLLILLDYAYEDWSGARAWAKAKAEIEAAGISLDPHTYIPPLVADAENFAALPIFQLEPDPKHWGARKPVALDRALAPIDENFSYSNLEASNTGKLPYLDNWERGEKTDMVVVQKQLLDFCRHASPPIQIPVNATPSEILGMICPALADLRVANLTRPSCRFNLDYDYSKLSAETLEPIISQLKLARVLAYEEKLSVVSGQPQLALDDFKVDWKLVSGLQQTPLLVDGFVTVGVVAIHLDVIKEGLAQHVWNDQQLKDLDDDLGKIDVLKQSQFCLRGDLAVCEIPLVTRCKNDPASVMRDYQKASYDEQGHPLDTNTYLYLWIKLWLSPKGSYNRYLANYAPFILPGNVVDIDSRRVFPEKAPANVKRTSNLTGQMDEISSLLDFVKNCSFSQARVDEARIACRLERYRLAHGNYPDSLDALVPAYGDDLPHDIMNGESYHYKLVGDGKYRLYSVGWNQKDDGGQYGPQGYGNSGGLDWVWTNYPDLEKTK